MKRIVFTIYVSLLFSWIEKFTNNFRLFAINSNYNNKVNRFSKIKVGVFLSFFFLSFSMLFAQNPGNVGTASLTGWWLPDGLPNGDLTSWTTTFPIGGSAITVTDPTGAPYPIVTDVPANNTSNYNKTVEFDSNSTTNLKYLRNTSASLDLLDNAATGDEGTLFVAYYFPRTSTGDHLLTYIESGSNDGIQLRMLGTNTGRIAIGNGIGTSTNATRNWVESFLPAVMSYNGNRSTSTSFHVFDRSLETGTTAASQASATGGIYMGYRNGTGAAPYNGYLHEYVFYDKDLSVLEMSKVNTYLAIKYGVTLLSTGGGTQGDYTGTNNTVIWDADDISGYQNDVIGIGRDDDQGLLQKQSHSFDDITRIYLDAIATTNSTNGGSFSSDNSYVMIGHNSGAMCSNGASALELPVSPTLFSRLGREWKITKSNFGQSFNLDWQLNTCAQLNNVDVDDLRVLIDDDGDFSNGGTSTYQNGDGSGITISYSNPLITIEDISNTHILNNNTAYITLASSSFDTPLPVELTDFIAKNSNKNEVHLSWHTVSEINLELFEIQRSTNSYDWKLIGQVQATGNNYSPQSYDLYDEEPISGNSYYRLKYIHSDETSSYSRVQSIWIDPLQEELIAYPNPNYGKFTLKLPQSWKTISIVDVLGQVVFEKVNDNKNITELIITDLEEGIYYVRAMSNTNDLIPIKPIQVIK